MPPNEREGDDDSSSPGPGGVLSTRIKRVFDYWIDLRRDRPFPDWSEVSLMDIYDVAPFVAVLDVEPGISSCRFRYRFCGTALVEFRSMLKPIDPTGHFMDRVTWPFDVSFLIGACERVVKDRKPAILAAGEIDESIYFRFERGFFPLGIDGGGVTQIMACIDRAEDG